MRKKLICLGIALVMIFGMIGLSGCDGSNPNEGYIYGLDNARFIAHFDRNFTLFNVFDTDRTLTKPISSRYELIEWQKKEFRELDERVGTNHLENFDYENFLAEYDDDFFVSHQLVFIYFSGSILDYEVERISYQDNVLTIKFISIQPRRESVPDVSHPHLAIIEITRISDDLNISFSNRRLNR